jgi:hypothetical protein
MKFSVTKLSMVLAVVLGIALAPAAWSATFTLLDPITGTVYECEPGTSGIQIEVGEDIISIFGMGPASYWEEQGVAFPEVGETITISVFEVTYLEADPKLVAQSVTIGDKTIVLRDVLTGVPLWRESKAALTQAKGNR